MNTIPTGGQFKESLPLPDQTPKTIPASQPSPEPIGITSRTKRQGDYRTLFSGLSNAIKNFTRILPERTNPLSKTSFPSASYNIDITKPDANKQFEVSYPGGIVRSGGTASWRNNNPGNIKFGDFAKQYGANVGSAAKDGGNFAAFPTLEAGMKAQRDLLRGKNYANDNLEHALRRWSGGIDPKTGKYNGLGYGINIVPADLRGKTLGQMTDAELNRLIQAQIRAEGWRAGTIQKQQNDTLFSTLQDYFGTKS